MAWRFDKPLVTLADDEQNKKAMQVWEGESLGGLTEDNMSDGTDSPRPRIRNSRTAGTRFESP
jgi:hypothetical protein